MDEIHLDDDDEVIIIKKKEWDSFKSYEKCIVCNKTDRISLRLSFNSGIGIKVEIVCRKCGWHKDLTDYDSW